MLRKIRIENVALISSQTIEFENGLSVFSGETGAGKSLVIDSLALVLGARADRNIISYGKQFAVVEAVFDNMTELTLQKLYDFGFDEEEDSLILFRKIYDDGRNDCRINGRSVTVGMLKEVASTLVDICGQFENQTMFKSSIQLSLIDDLCSNKQLLLQLSEKLDQIKAIDSKLELLGGDENERERLLDMLAFQIDEIEEANFQENEEENLKLMHNKIVAKEKVVNSIVSALDALENIHSCSVYDSIQSASQYLSVASGFEADIEIIRQKLIDINFEINELNNDLKAWVDKYTDVELDIDSIESRLDLLNNFKKKYGKSIPEIWQFCNNAKNKFDDLKNNKEKIEKLKSQRNILYDEANVIAEELHNVRVAKSVEFASDIKCILSELGMKNASFNVNIERQCKINYNGFDTVVFMFSANSGIPLRALSKVASGGELARFMLALKCVLGLHGHIATMIFDEIDSGISGQTANIVGQKLYQISNTCQVICISHLAQIACFADNNYLIEKFDDGISAQSSVTVLSSEQKINEIARLLGGFGDNVHARLHAVELIDTANLFKFNNK